MRRRLSYIIAFLAEREDCFVTGIACNKCGKTHNPEDLAWHTPWTVYLYDMTEAEREQRCVVDGETCVIDGENFFIHGRLIIPVLQSDKSLIFGAWSTLSKKNFDRALDSWETVGREKEPPYFGWFMAPPIRRILYSREYNSLENGAIAVQLMEGGHRRSPRRLSLVNKTIADWVNQRTFLSFRM